MKREDMKGIVGLAFRRYLKLKGEIAKGFIKAEHVLLVTDWLFLKELTNEELNEMWNASHDFFDGLYCNKDKDGKVVGFKTYSEETEFARDTQSAWSEVINCEARKRREKALM